MDPLRFCLLVPALLAAAPAHGDEVARWRPYIDEASARFGLPTAWIARVMRMESGGHTQLGGRPIRSPAGAMGLMQIMPETWAGLRARLGLGEDPDNPRDNILAGAYYLRRMYDRFGYPGLFGAYNAGPGRYADHLATGRALPRETRAYLARLVQDVSSPPHSALPRAGRLFFARADAPPTEATDEPKCGGSLFVVCHSMAARAVEGRAARIRFDTAPTESARPSP